MKSEKLIKVRARTGARNEEIRELKPDHFGVSVREKPENNAANKRIMELVASHFGIPASNIRIIKGHHRASKTLVLLKTD